MDLHYCEMSKSVRTELCNPRYCDHKTENSYGSRHETLKVNMVGIAKKYFDGNICWWMEMAKVYICA
jgi:hypothetical protein